jgi:PAS domain S-box-containing protein
MDREANDSDRVEVDLRFADAAPLLHALLANIPDRIYFKDAQSRFVLVSPAMARFFGVNEPADMIGKTDFDFFSPEHAIPAFQDEQEVMRTGIPIVGKMEEERFPDGRVGWASTTKLPLRDSAGRIVGTFGVSRDVTDRKLAQDQLEQANASLARREQELLSTLDDLRRSEQQLRSTQLKLFQAEKLASLGQLVAGIAHEINNPLAFVVNNIAVLRRDMKFVREVMQMYQSADPVLARHHPDLMGRIGDLSERVDLPYLLAELGTVLDRSKEGLGRIQQIVQDLRDFSQHEVVGDIEVAADLNASVEATAQIARGRARSRQVELELDLAPLPPIDYAPAKINQVLINLIVNAIDACSAGGKVTVRTRPNDRTVMVQVIDNGRGIEPAIREKIFDPYFTTKPQGQGTGLGLSISYGIVAEHGGKIEIESTPGQGSTFTMHLPESATVRQPIKSP